MGREAGRVLRETAALCAASGRSVYGGAVRDPRRAMALGTRRSALLLAQPGQDARGVLVGREDGVPDVLDAPALAVPGHALEERRRSAGPRRDLDRGEGERASELEPGIGEDREGDVHALGELALVRARLRADREHGDAEGAELPEEVAEPAGLW